MDTVKLTRVRDDARVLAAEARSEGHKDAEKALTALAESADQILHDPAHFEIVGAFQAAGVAYGMPNTGGSPGGEGSPGDRAENP